MLKHLSIVYFMMRNDILKGRVAAVDLYKDDEFGQKYSIELDEPYIHEEEEYYFLSIPESELYLNRQDLLEQ